MQVLPMLGWYAGLPQYNIPKIFLSSAQHVPLYSEDGYPNDLLVTPTAGQYFCSQRILERNPNMQVGAEYLRGWRTNRQFHQPCQPYEPACTVFFLININKIEAASNRYLRTAS